MIDTLLFDLDNTLLDFDKAEAHALTKALDDARISVTDEMLRRYNKINLTQWKLLEQGKMTRDEVKIRRFKLLFQEFFNFLSLEVKVSKNKSRLWTCFDLSWLDRFLLNYQLVGKEIGMLSLTFILLLVTVACSIS